MASSYDVTKEVFNPETAKLGQAFTSNDLKGYAKKSWGMRDPYIRFVCMYDGAALFEYFDYNRYENGLPRGGVSQNFSLFSMYGLTRDPDNDWIDDGDE